ncbi:MAG: hypothetical protein CME68_11160 [Halobacteriovoraceae bacterium]|nr:hypothetical protein [Halobacteriovoraceae bacterium]
MRYYEGLRSFKSKRNIPEMDLFMDLYGVDNGDKDVPHNHLFALFFNDGFFEYWKGRRCLF